MKQYKFLDLSATNQRYLSDLKAASLRVIESGRYIGGEEVEEFQNQVSELCQTPHCVGTSNGLDALRLIFEAYKILGKLKEGDEVIVPANTFIASVLAITHAGLKPVLVDPDIDTMVLTAEGIEKALSDSTRAILTVHLFGRIAWSREMAELAKKNDLIVVEDAAQSIGARSTTPGLFNTNMAGSLGHAGAFSFYPTKNIGALGDAGAVCTHCSQLAEIVKALSNYGSVERYNNIYAGFNCRLDTIQAALLRVKLPYVDEVNQHRQEIAQTYCDTISHPLVVAPPHPSDPRECVWHQYVIRVRESMRDKMREYLKNRGVETDIHYPTPVHLQQCYKSLAQSKLPIAETLANESISLPINDSVTADEAVEIAKMINSFYMI